VPIFRLSGEQLLGTPWTILRSTPHALDLGPYTPTEIAEELERYREQLPAILEAIIAQPDPDARLFAD
jgi:hypothetical protein